jgi:hypothetical protein
VVKADDDVFLNLSRLIAASGQWDKMGAQYVGCMVRVQPQQHHDSIMESWGVDSGVLVCGPASKLSLCRLTCTLRRSMGTPGASLARAGTSPSTS